MEEDVVGEVAQRELRDFFDWQALTKPSDWQPLLEMMETNISPVLHPGGGWMYSGRDALDGYKQCEACKSSRKKGERT